MDGQIHGFLREISDQSSLAHGHEKKSPIKAHLWRIRVPTQNSIFMKIWWTSKHVTCKPLFTFVGSTEAGGRLRPLTPPKPSPNHQIRDLAPKAKVHIYFDVAIAMHLGGGWQISGRWHVTEGWHISCGGVPHECGGGISLGGGVNHGFLPHYFAFFSKATRWQKLIKQPSGCLFCPG